MGDGDLHSPHNLPIVLAGSGCGALKPGRHVRAPFDTPFMNLCLSLLDKVDVHLEQPGRQHRAPGRRSEGDGAMRRIRARARGGVAAAGRRGGRRSTVPLAEAVKTRDAEGRARACCSSASTSTRRSPMGRRRCTGRRTAATASPSICCFAPARAPPRRTGTASHRCRSRADQRRCGGRRAAARGAAPIPNAAWPGGETVLMTAARAGRVDAVRAAARGTAPTSNAREATRGSDGADVGGGRRARRCHPRCSSRHGADIKRRLARARRRTRRTSLTASQTAYRRTAPRIDVFTPLQFAVHAGQIEAARALLDAGASLARRNAAGHGASHAGDRQRALRAGGAAHREGRRRERRDRSAGRRSTSSCACAR